MHSYSDSTGNERREIINKIEYGFSNIGFILLKGHQLDQQLISSAFNTNRKFFNLPSQILSSTIVQSPVPRGYAPINTENFGALIGKIKPNDLNCKFRMGPEYHNKTKIKTHKNNKQYNKNDESSDNELLDAYYGTKGARCLLYPNIWPSIDTKHQCENQQIIIKQFKSSLLRMYDKLYKIAQILFDIFELIFVDKHGNKPLNFNKMLFNKHTSILSTNYYPTQSEIKSKYNLDLSSDRLAIEEHSDIDIFTIIIQNNNEGGVQVKLNDKWLSIPYDAKNNYLMVNIGDGFQYLTNNKWKSTKHRVLIPQNNTPRQVIAFFAAFNYEALMKPLIQRKEICEDQDAQKNDEDANIVTYFKWRTKRIRRVVQHLKQQQKQLK